MDDHEDVFDEHNDSDSDASHDDEVPQSFMHQEHHEINDVNIKQNGKKKKKIKKKKKLYVRIHDEITKETAELDRLLYESHSLREDNLKKQNQAFMKFEEDLLSIGDLSGVEEYFTSKDRHVSKAVDHNLTRMMMSSINASKPMSSSFHNRFMTSESSPGSYGDDDFEDEHDDGQADEHHPNITSSEKPTTATRMQRKNIEPPSFETKGNIRVKIIDLLEGSRSKESQLEEELVTARAEDPKKRVSIADELYHLQKENLSRLTHLINEYRPSASSKPWGSEPEQIEFSQRIRDALLLDDPVASGKSIAATHSHTNMRSSRAQRR